MDNSVIYRAGLLVPRPGVVIDDGALVVAEGKVADVDKYNRARKGVYGETRDLGDVALIPGLVNAHTHLELTHLKGQVPARDKFTDWLLDVMRLRSELSEDEILTSARAGVEEALRSGTTCIGAVSNTGICAKAFENVPMRRVIFHEIPGYTDVSGRIANVEARLQRKANGAPARDGIAPHAPYSTCREIYEWSIKIATGLRLPLSTHVAETRTEAEFLKTGGGEFREYLLQLGVPLDGWRPPGTGPIRYLADLGFLKACVQLVHCNYVSDDDIALLQGCNVVLCPRSQAYLGHTGHPFRKLRECGVTVALGTDSLASNDSLSVLDEMKFLHSRNVEPEAILEMATVAGARALGMQEVTGSLEPGRSADFCAVGAAGAVRRIEDIFAPDSFVAATVVGGRVIWRREE